jgi:hypothetical protein
MLLIVTVGLNTVGIGMDERALHEQDNSCNNQDMGNCR